MKSSAMPHLFQRAASGDRRALARLLTRAERDEADLRQLMSLAQPMAGSALVIGVTGPPGAGKSTIVDALTRRARARHKSVGILAVDPTSPFTGGAVLGDRIRMQDHHLDRGVFIRSLATRGVHGGLARVSQAAVKLLDAIGKDIVLVETVGVGQTELDILDVADLVTVVLVPEAGDTIQAMKAGLLEIADLFVVNKADRDGAGQLASALMAMLSLDPRPKTDLPPVLLTQAHTGEGIDELYRETLSRMDAMKTSGQLEERRRRHARREVIRLVTAALAGAVQRAAQDGGPISHTIQAVESGELDPHAAARRILASDAIASILLTRADPSEQRRSP